ncbi:ABC transporter substrate-binding protein [Ruania albidiflava]|uniref:ABC transporter substrate-binding protein n=1 Tax=Ruania albidiflava TaxID=366586 RepID=UPI0003B5BB48|nr:extracellular solute-binding protein [Ruania albidiflava]
MTARNRRSTPRYLPLAAAATAATLALTACSSGSDGGGEPGSGGTVDPDEQITLTMYWWGNEDRADRYNEAIELFEEEYPNIDVQANYSAWDDYWPARATEAAGSSLPDVFQMDLAYLSQYGGRNQLVDLTPYLGGELDATGMPEELLDSGRVGDGLYAIPQSTNTLAMFSNPELIEELGVEAPTADMTWSDYAQWAAEAAGAGADADPALYGAYDFTGVFWLFIQYMVQNGNEVFTDDGELAFTEDDVLEWLSLASDLRAEGQVWPPDRAAQFDPLDGFSAQEVATSGTWDNFLAMYYADTGLDELDILPIPTVEGNDARGLFQKPSMLLSAGQNTEHPEAAAALINFITNDAEAGAIFGTSRGVPATESARSEMDVSGTDEQVITFEEEMADEITEPVPTLPEGFGTIEAAWLRLSETLAYGEITEDEFVQQWFAEAESALP